MKLLNATRSPSAKQRTPQKCYKHIALFSLNNITKVCDILQNNDDTDLFGILCRLAGEKDKFFSFKVLATSSMYHMNGSSNQSANNSSIGSGSLTLNSTAGFNQSTSTLSSASNNMNYGSLYASSTNLNFTEEHFQAQMEKKEYIKLLAQGICNVKCITEYVS